ncbi:MAG: family 16 glycosylhydrolase [bacterium]|nr:MAG: family 16 glycosylhydrolase [bacterium]
MKFTDLRVLALFTILGTSLFAKDYKGAELRTNSTFLYGRFEVRMRSAAGSGMLSSFFTYHDSPNVPAQWNEIDIEILGKSSNSVQFNIITQGQVGHEVTKTVQFNPHQAFHIYAIEWTPDYVAWRVDGFEIYREIRSHVSQLYYTPKLMMNIWPPDAVGWVGALNPASLPLYAYYDWVKYYEYTPGSGDNFTLLWQDDFTAWNQARWSKGTHTWYGNLCDFIPQNAVFQDGYMILCLTDALNIGYSGAPISDLDIDPPYMVWARVYPDHIRVFFSEPVDPVTAQNVSNYLMANVTITQATLLSDNRTVILDAQGLIPSQVYNLIAMGIKDLNQPPNVMSASSIITKLTIGIPAGFNVAGPSWQNYYADQIWTENDEYGYTGGNPTLLPDTVLFNNTTEDDIYRSEMRNAAFYHIRLPDGLYDITLMFAETQFSSPSARIFDVYAEGQLVLDNLNIYSEAGLQQFTAVEKTVSHLSVDDGILELYFESVVGDPVISGIKIEEVPSGINQNNQIPTGLEWDLYPNPFNGAFTIRYHLNQSQWVEIDLYNIRGQHVRKMMRNFEPPGLHISRYQFADLSSGIYLVSIKLQTGIMDVKKIAYLK